MQQLGEHLEFGFTDDWAMATDDVEFTVRVANVSQVPIYAVELFAGPPGLPLNKHSAGSFSRDARVRTGSTS